MDTDTTFNSFQYFIDMKNPENKNDKREELTILFLTNLMNEQETLDGLNQDYIDTKGKGHQEKFNDLWELIFDKYEVLGQI